jgi:hypothetical protein
MPAKAKKINPPDALDQLAADAANGTGALSVPLAGKPLRVLPPMEWRSSAMRAVREGNFDVWAEKCLVRDSESDDYAIWQSVDPTMNEITQFLIAYRDAGGSGLGE